MRKILAVLVSLFFCGVAHAATVINDTETERLLYELVSPIAVAADISPARLKIHIVRSDEFNAFVMGGEDVYIYTGLLTRVKSPGALRAVVAHELGHTIGGHMAQMSARMAAELKRTVLIQALGVGLMFAGGNPSLGAGVLAGAGGIATQSMLAFSRDEERIADNTGLDLMVRAGCDPHGFVEVFEQMHEMTGAMESKINPNRINHPLTAERLNNVRDYIARTPGKYKSDSHLSDRYDLVRAKLVGYLDGAARISALYPDTDKSDAAMYARAIYSMRAGDLKVAAASTDKLISRNPNNPYFYELKGDLEFQLGHYDASVTAYEHALKIMPNAPQIQTALALVLTDRRAPGDAARALELCRRSILAAPSPLAYWTMARAFDDARADWAMAEYYHLISDSKNAKIYAKKARKSLDPETPEYIKAGELIKSK